MVLLLGAALSAESIVSKKKQSLSWSQNFSYKASLFSSAAEGSALSIDYTNTKDSYHKCKLYAKTPSWTTLGAGTAQGALLENGELVPLAASGTIVYTLTEAEAAALRKYGMAMNGYGMTVSAIRLSPAAGGGQQQSSGAQRRVVYEGGYDLGNWSFVSIGAEQFSSLEEGSALSVTTGPSPSSAENPAYLNIKLYSGTWRSLSTGTVGGDASKRGDVIVPHGVSGSFSYTLDGAEAAAVRADGLIVQGYAMTVQRLEILPPGSAASRSSPASGGAPVSAGQPGGAGTAAAKPAESPRAAPAPAAQASAATPFGRHGALHVSGAALCDAHNEPCQLYGMSTHGLNFGKDFSRYVNREAFATLRDDWNTNCIRLVLYPRDYNGWCNGGNQKELMQIVCDGIDYATELGMYVIVDWHVHNYRPLETKAQAKAFLSAVSEKYASYGNVLYEICNEPTGSPWKTAIKPYAEEIIPVIRSHAPDAVIIVGTDTWSQDIEGPLSDPLSFRNVMYTFHFYAQSHTDSFRRRVESAVQKGLPVFVTEFGTCDASGNGGFNAAQTRLWFDLLAKYNISHCNWSLSNKSETASVLNAWCGKTSSWSESDLTESGRLIRSHFRSLRP